MTRMGKQKLRIIKLESVAARLLTQVSLSVILSFNFYGGVRINGILCLCVSPSRVTGTILQVKALLFRFKKRLLFIEHVLYADTIQKEKSQKKSKSQAKN